MSITCPLGKIERTGYQYNNKGKTINVIDLENQEALLELKAEHREQQIDKILKEDL
jgi:hypothetical protein